jgi:16S rRNA (uracil1498-N3)-methyltransferase
MRELWFHCPVLQPGQVTLADSEARHAGQSLRLQPGDAVTLFDGNGHLGRGAIADEVPAAGSKRNRQRPLTVLVEGIQTVPRPACALTLVVPGCKGARLDWLIEKGTELGVARFILVELEHSVVHTGPQHAGKLERTAIEACKQCHRAWRPRIEAGLTLVGALATCPGATLLAAHLDAEAPAWGDWLAAHRPVPADIAVVIGPEGGLSVAEIAALRTAGAQTVRLGEHILRVETAALAIAACWAASGWEPGGRSSR